MTKNWVFRNESPLEREQQKYVPYKSNKERWYKEGGREIKKEGKWEERKSKGENNKKEKESKRNRTRDKNKIRKREK